MQARQSAIDLAQGEWIAFIDQDDIWLPHKLERQLALASERPEAALIYGRTVRFYPNGTERDYDQAHEYANLPEGDIFAELFTNSCFIAMSSAMFRRSAIEAIGGIPGAITIIPDYYLYTAITRRFPAAAVQEVVCRYRMHDANTSQTTAIRVHEEALRLMDMWHNDVDPKVLAKCKASPLHPDCPRRDASAGHILSWNSAAPDRRVRCLAASASFLLRLSFRKAKRHSSLLEATCPVSRPAILTDRLYSLRNHARSQHHHERSKWGRHAARGARKCDGPDVRVTGN